MTERVVLLDVNCLVALAWPNHAHHNRASAWFLHAGAHSWATTPAVQIGFVRISMNSLITGSDVPFAAARAMLGRLLSFGSHTLLKQAPAPSDWPDWLADRVQGYRQVPDAALVASAVINDTHLATLDERLMDLLDATHRDMVRLIPV